MSSINFENVKALVWQQLEGLDKNLFYHGRHHTFDDVLPTAIEIGKAENLTEEQLLIVSTAALYHDTGFLDQYEKNEPMGVERARQQLPQFGYTQDQIDQIAACIMATQVPQQPASNILAQVVCDADLAHLGKDTYFLRGEALRLELNRVKKANLSVRKWHESNITFLQKHNYWTNFAKTHFQAVKMDHIEATKELLHC